MGQPRFAAYRGGHLDLSRHLTDERDPKIRGPLLEMQRGLVEAFKPAMEAMASDKLWLPFSGEK